MPTYYPNGMQLTVLVTLAGLFLLFGFMAGVRFANSEYRRDRQWATLPQPAPLPVPVPEDRRDFYARQRPAPASPISLTVNVHAAAPVATPQRAYVLNGEVIPELPAVPFDSMTPQ